MACLYPKPAYLGLNGKVQFTSRDKALGRSGYIHIRCGMCNGCKADLARDWAIRCYHEAQLHERACFITLTYSQTHVPVSGSLQPEDLQKFFKRFRKSIHPKRVRFFAAGEYGEKKGRPHYHAVIFGWQPDTREIVGKSQKGHLQYRSPVLENAWPYGFAPWTDFDVSCARYVAHYTADKLKSFAAQSIDPETGLRPYEKLDEKTGEIWKLHEEFQRSSNRPGLGIPWLELNYREVFPSDTVVMDGKEYPPPRAYYKWLKDNHPDLYATVRAARREKSLETPYETGLRLLQKSMAVDHRLKKFIRPTHEEKK